MHGPDEEDEIPAAPLEEYGALPAEEEEPFKILKMTGLDSPEGPVEGFTYMYATENK